jgi:cytochrome bd ubiquinol oxidase subunit I
LASTYIHLTPRGFQNCATHTEKGASLILGGIPDKKEKQVHYAIKLPYLLSILAYGNAKAEVKGLEEFPESNWPPIMIVHVAFQVMVGAGSALAALGMAFLYLC